MRRCILEKRLEPKRHIYIISEIVKPMGHLGWVLGWVLGPSPALLPPAPVRNSKYIVWSCRRELGVRNARVSANCHSGQSVRTILEKAASLSAAALRYLRFNVHVSKSHTEV